MGVGPQDGAEGALGGMDVAVVLILVRRDAGGAYWLLYDEPNDDQDRPWVLHGGARVDWDEWCGASGGRLVDGSVYDAGTPGSGGVVVARLLDRLGVVLLVDSSREDGWDRGGGDGDGDRDDGAKCSWASRWVGTLVRDSSCSAEWSMLGGETTVESAVGRLGTSDLSQEKGKGMDGVAQGNRKE